MNEDPALTLRKAVDRGQAPASDEIQSMLVASPLVERLLVTPKQKLHLFTGVRAYEWRLLELTEIPFAHTLPTVQAWRDTLYEITRIDEGYSLTGDRDGVMACHNAMLTLVMLKHQHPDRAAIDAGIQWILDHQNVARGQPCLWDGKDLNTRWGGCMKNAPCLYGVIKSMRTLTTYQKVFGPNPAVQAKLDAGLDYILKHHGYRRLSTGEPIEPSMVEMFFPYPYKSNVLEVLTLLKENGRLDDPRCADALEVLRDHQRPDGYWQADKVFMKSAWVLFDPLGKAGAWITYMAESILNS